MEAKAVAIYSQMGWEEVAWYLESASTDSEKAAIVEELASRSEGELLGCLEQIVAVLQSTVSAEVRAAVCRAVQTAGENGLVYCQDIMVLLNEEDADVKYSACTALAAMGPPARVATQSLERLLSDQSEAVRCAACAALGALEATNCTAKIAEKLSDPSPEVQGAACLALGKLGEDGAQSAVDIASKIDEPRSRLQAIAALGTMESTAGKYCDKIVECLADKDPEIRFVAAQQCGQLAKGVKENAGAWQKLMGLLGDSDGRTRCAAALAMGYMGNQAVDHIDSIKDMLDDDFSESGVTPLTAGGCRSRVPPAARNAKCAAALALGLICQATEEVAADVYAVEVTRLLDSDDWEVRMVGCEALAMMGTGAKDQAVKVASIFDDERFEVRSRAAYACGKLQDAETASGLADLISDNCPSVRAEAVLALAELGEDGSEYIERVYEKVNDYSPSVRAAAMAALSKMGEKGQLYAGALGQKLLEYDAPFVQVAIIEALGNMEDRGAAYADIVSEYLQDPVPAIRAAAAASLGKMGPEGKAFASMIKSMSTDPSSVVQQAADKAMLALVN